MITGCTSRSGSQSRLSWPSLALPPAIHTLHHPRCCMYYSHPSGHFLHCLHQIGIVLHTLESLILSQKAQPCRDKRPQLFFLRCPRCSKSKFLLAPSCRRHLQPLLSLKSPSVPISSASERNKLLVLDPPNARTNIFISANMVPETRNTPSKNMAFPDFPSL